MMGSCFCIRICFVETRLKFDAKFENGLRNNPRLRVSKGLNFIF